MSLRVQHLCFCEFSLKYVLKCLKNHSFFGVVIYSARTIKICFVVTYSAVYRGQGWGGLEGNYEGRAL